MPRIISKKEKTGTYAFEHLYELSSLDMASLNLFIGSTGWHVGYSIMGTHSKRMGLRHEMKCGEAGGTKKKRKQFSHCLAYAQQIRRKRYLENLYKLSGTDMGSLNHFMGSSGCFQ